MQRPLPRSRSQAASLIAVALGAGLLSACSSSIDTSKVEKALVTDLNSNNEVGASVGAAKCPESVKPKKGDTFECTVEIDGQTAHYTLTQKDNSGNLVWRRTDAVLDVKKIETQVTAGLLDQIQVKAKVDCGTTKVKLLKPGSTFTCKATSDSDSAVVEVTASDLTGNVEWKLK
jgi:hypothetical protein